jgi:hypothetical protein
VKGDAAEAQGHADVDVAGILAQLPPLQRQMLGGRGQFPFSCGVSAASVMTVTTAWPGRLMTPAIGGGRSDRAERTGREGCRVRPPSRPFARRLRR